MSEKIRSTCPVFPNLMFEEATLPNGQPTLSAYVGKKQAKAILRKFKPRSYLPRKFGKKRRKELGRCGDKLYWITNRAGRFTIDTSR